MKSNTCLRTEAAFTLTELCVVIVCIGVVGLLVLPALAGSKSNSQGLRCLENTRRLTMAWRMYAEDNSDLMVYSSDDDEGTAPYSTSVAGSNKGNLYAWTWSKMDFNGGNPWNWDTNADITLRPLWQYVKDTTVYKCPADASQVTLTSLPSGYAGPYAVGSVVPRIRSYSMNFFLGGFGNNTEVEDYALWAKYFPVYLKLTELGNRSKSPGPGQTFIFTCERSDTINWGDFGMDMSGAASPANNYKANPSQYQWTEDFPSSYHDFAAGISFADGHAELHRWTNPSTSPLPQTILSGGRDGDTFPAPYSQDVAWMQNVSARPH